MSEGEERPIRLLAVDDEDSIRLLYSRALGAGLGVTPGFDVALCSQGGKAVEAVRRAVDDGDPFAVAFVDIRMPPGPDGVWTAERMRAADPDINIVIVTGHADADPREIAERVMPPQRLLYLHKPLSVREIRHIALSFGSKWRVEKLLQQSYQELEERVRERTEELAEANEKLRRDLAERERMQAELHLRDAAIDSAANAVIITDREGTLLSVNPAFTHLTGYSSREAIGQNPRILKSGEQDAGFYEGLWKTIGSGKVWQGEIVNRHKDGHTYIEEQTITPVRDSRGAITHFVAIKQDITRRKKAEEKAQLQQQQLIQADKMASLGVLVSGVAHEINNPNHFVKMSASLLNRAWDDILPVLDRYYGEREDALVSGLTYHEFRDHVPTLLTRILEGSERISHIVNELRDFARQRPPDLSESVDVNDVIRAAVVLLSNMVKKSTRRFSAHYGEGIPRIKGDFRRLEQVVVNLVQNACQALPDDEKGVTVSASYTQGDSCVEVTVQDEGIGIPEDAMGRIMDPFFTTKRDSGGTGLGLSVSSAIVREHNGTLNLSSVPGQGTTARLLLPVPRDEGRPQGRDR